MRRKIRYNGTENTIQWDGKYDTLGRKIRDNGTANTIHRDGKYDKMYFSTKTKTFMAKAF